MDFFPFPWPHIVFSQFTKDYTRFIKLKLKKKMLININVGG